MKFWLLVYLFLCSVPSIAEPRLLWGDTHVHTVFSADAYINNNLTADPDTAYRYARGLPVVHPYHRARVKIATPLDFLVVTDHAAFLGVTRQIHREGVIVDGLGFIDTVKAKLAGWVLRRAVNKQSGAALMRSALPKPKPPREAAGQSLISGRASMIPQMLSVQRDAWMNITNAADYHNNPGKFSALIGWEWGSIPGGANLHRVIISDSNAATAQQYRPFSAIDSLFPEDLWTWLDEISDTTDASYIAIPHNSNISKGIMFDQRSLRGQPFSAPYVAKRMRWERLVEITQTKGDSETHSQLSPQDPFADFENFPYYIQGGYTPYSPEAGDFVRPALMRGLRLGRDLGQNPFQFGVIGSTDSHTALSSAEEDNFWGKMATDSIPENKFGEPNPEYPRSTGWAMSASGLAAVWAQDNTRTAIVEAMRRRHVYATTGPRITLQFFAGAGLSLVDPNSVDLYQHLAGSAVPMGGELKGLSESPEFLVMAAKDPRGANLDRIQIVKGWLDATGEVHEKLFNVAWSDDRKLTVDGSLPAVGNSVDMSSGSYTNSIGAPQLSGVWRDPEFDALQSAFYYVRVLQIPTPRHSLYDAIALQLPRAGEHVNSIQERAYSSPIWIVPASGDERARP